MIHPEEGWEITEEILAKEIDSKFQHQLTPPPLDTSLTPARLCILLTLFEEAISINS